VLAGGGAKQYEQKREAESQRQGEQTKTRVKEIQELHIRMNLHYKPGRLREETIDLSVNRWKREGSWMVNRFKKLPTIGISVTGREERINLEGNGSAKIPELEREPTLMG